MLASALAGIPLVVSSRHFPAMTGSAFAQAPATAANTLVIDAHTHIFNAEDVPLFGFATHIWIDLLGGLERVAQFILSPVALILDAVIQLAAPGHKNELQKLKDLNEANRARAAGGTGTNPFVSGEAKLPRFDEIPEEPDFEDPITRATDPAPGEGPEAEFEAELGEDVRNALRKSRRSAVDFQLRHDFILALEDNNGDVNIYDWAQEQLYDTLDVEDREWLLDDKRLSQLRDEAQELDEEERRQILAHLAEYQEYLIEEQSAPSRQNFVGRIILKFTAWFLLRGKLKIISAVLKRLISYRSTNVKNLIKDFKKERRRHTDLDVFVSALVDFDKWSGNDVSTYRTSIEKQIDIMAEMSEAFDGRILPFVAFCPYRQVEVEWKNRTTGSQDKTPLDLVKDALTTKGFVGVKLYPQLGFRPRGNAAFDTQPGFLWPYRSSAFKPREIDQGGKKFGELLDDAMLKFFRYCVPRDIPIMTHGNDSLGTRKNGSDCGNPIYWEQVLTFNSSEFRNLRLNIGHMGGYDDVTCRNPGNTCEADDWSLKIAGLMKTWPNVYSDLSNFEPVVMGGKNRRNRNRETLKQALQTLFGTGAQGNAGMSKLMYGSDWHMPINKLRYRKYFDQMEKLGNDVLSGNKKNFTGGAATKFLGLNPGDATRNRLNSFYSGRGMTPDWTTKI